MISFRQCRLNRVCRVLTRSQCIDSGIGILEGPPVEVTQSPTALLLSPLDYPASYRGTFPHSKLYAHPNDYKIDNEPIKPEVFLHKGASNRNRLFFRTSFLLPHANTAAQTKYTSATFLVDTGYCSHLLICDDLAKILGKRVMKYELPLDYVNVRLGNNDYRCEVSSDASVPHKSVNVIGLPMIFTLGLKFKSVDFWKLTGDAERCVRDIATFDPFTYL